MPQTADPQAPEARAAERRAITQPIGVSGLRQFSGYIREEFLRDLEGQRGRQIFDEMSKNDSTCGAILFAIKNLLRALNWRVVPSDPANSRAIEAAELLEGMLFYDMEHTWPDFIESACSMFVYGFDVHEIVWKQRKGVNASKPWLSSDFDDGLWAPRAFAPRSQKTIIRWIYDDSENLLGFEQWPLNDTPRVVPIRRCLHFRTTAELDNPEGISLLRTAYRSWYWLKRLQEIEGIGTERDLAGYPVLKVPGEMLDPKADKAMMASRAVYEDFLRRVRRDQNEGVLLPSDRDEKGNPFYEFSLMSTGGTRQLRIDESITRYQKDIARSVLADFIFLGSDGSGSLALGRTKVQFFIEAMKGFARNFVSQINEVAVSQIWRMNGFDFEICPTVEPGDIERADLSALGGFITAMANVGFDLGTDTELENHLRAAADLPPAPDRSEDDDFVPMPSGRQVKAAVTFDENGDPVSPATNPDDQPGGRGEDDLRGSDTRERPAGHGDVKDEDETDEALGKAMRAAWGPPDDGLDVPAFMEGFRHG